MPHNQTRHRGISRSHIGEAFFLAIFYKYFKIFFVYENIFELFKSNHFKLIYIFEKKKSIDISMDSDC